MLKSINKYIKNNDFSINIWDKHIDINNFKEIVILEENKVVINTYNNRIIIKGNNITINKLLDNEILLSGDFTSIEKGE